jgi:hypothetical protein
MRLFFAVIGLFVLAIAAAGAILFVYLFAVYNWYLPTIVKIFLIAIVIVGAVWLVERAWRKMIGGLDE